MVQEASSFRRLNSEHTRHNKQLSSGAKDRQFGSKSLSQFLAATCCSRVDFDWRGMFLVGWLARLCPFSSWCCCCDNFIKAEYNGSFQR